jgi:leucyl-tRNA synthetase
MIQGRSNFVYRIAGTNKFVSYNLKDQFDTQPLHVDVNIVENDVLDIEMFKKWRSEFETAEFILEDGKYICGWTVEKMGKRYHNVVNPDDIAKKYGADTLRLYEMFLGPLEQSKPWDTAGIEGVHKFLRKVWRLFIDKDENLKITDEQPSQEELKILHRTIKKTEEDIERFAFNTAVSSFMICVNELTDLKCTKRKILEPLLIILSPFAPFICEELWFRIGNNYSVCLAKWVNYNADYLTESMIQYPVSFNGKTRFLLQMPVDASVADIEKTVMENEQTHKWIENKQVKKVIIVPKKIINIVI